MERPDRLKCKTGLVALGIRLGCRPPPGRGPTEGYYYYLYPQCAPSLPAFPFHSSLAQGSHPTRPPTNGHDMEQPALSSTDEKGAVEAVLTPSSRVEGPGTADDGLINASGHRQELDRNFNLVSICSYAITAGNAWVSLGGTIVCLLLSFPGLRG